VRRDWPKCFQGRSANPRRRLRLSIREPTVPFPSLRDIAQVKRDWPGHAVQERATHFNACSKGCPPDIGRRVGSRISGSEPADRTDSGVLPMRQVARWLAALSRGLRHCLLGLHRVFFFFFSAPHSDNSFCSGNHFAVRRRRQSRCYHRIPPARITADKHRMITGARPASRFGLTESCVSATALAPMAYRSNRLHLFLYFTLPPRLRQWYSRSCAECSTSTYPPTSHVEGSEHVCASARTSSSQPRQKGLGRILRRAWMLLDCGVVPRPARDFGCWRCCG